MLGKLADHTPPILYPLLIIPAVFIGLFLLGRWLIGYWTCLDCTRVFWLNKTKHKEYFYSYGGGPASVDKRCTSCQDQKEKEEQLRAAELSPPKGPSCLKEAFK